MNLLSIKCAIHMKFIILMLALSALVGTPALGHAIEAANFPQANPGGPYVVDVWLNNNGSWVGSDLYLDGSASTDPNIVAGDYLQYYGWDLNGDGIYGDANGINPTLTWAQL